MIMLIIYIKMHNKDNQTINICKNHPKEQLVIKQSLLAQCII